MERNHDIDGLRGLAALAVVAAHAGAALFPGHSAASVFDLGHFGVVVFFVCSGAVIPAAVARAGALPFWRGRIRRLYPAYWLSIALVLGLAALGLARSYPGLTVRAPESAADLLLNASMLQSWFGVPHLIGVYWTLYVELIWYALATILARYGLLDRRAGVMAALCLLALMTRAPLLIYLCLIWSGALLDRPRWFLLPLLPVAFAPFAIGTQLAIAAGLCAAWLAIARPSRFVRRFRPVGTVSYSLYLTHAPLLVALPWWSWPLALPLAAWLSWRVAERPFMPSRRARTTSPPRSSPTPETV